MCTVIIHVGESASDPIRMIAIRDEDPARPWNPLGRWWPDTHSGVVGVRDVRAGGAWLAADPDEHRLAVLLNREDLSDRSEDEVVSRGSIVLASVAGLLTRRRAADPRLQPRRGGARCRERDDVGRHPCPRPDARARHAHDRAPRRRRPRDRPHRAMARRVPSHTARECGCGWLVGAVDRDPRAQR